MTTVAGSVGVLGELDVGAGQQRLHGGVVAAFVRDLPLPEHGCVVRTGCAWRYLPADFPPWETVYGRFRQWNKRGSPSGS